MKKILQEIGKMYPATAKYIEKHGWDLPTYYFKESNFQEREELLKRCLEEGKTWEQISPAEPNSIF